MKTKALLLTLIVTAGLFTGCGKQSPPAEAPKTETAAADSKKTDAMTSASVVDNNEDFEMSIMDDGTWIVAITKDLTFDNELEVYGEFKNGKKDEKTGEELLQRKIALYTQDENRKVTARFTLTAPKITFNSPFGSLEHGTFKGDVYVAGKNFKLVNQQIQGNLYFLNEEAQNTFTIQDKEDGPKSTITGKQELKK